EGEAVVVTPHDSTLHTFNEVGSRILDLADGTRTLQGIVDVIVTEYDVDPEVAAKDAEALVSELVEKRVLLLADEPVRPEELKWAPPASCWSSFPPLRSLPAAARSPSPPAAIPAPRSPSTLR